MEELFEIQSKNSNDIWIDWNEPNTQFVSTNNAVFLWPDWALLHQELGSYFSKLKPVYA